MSESQQYSSANRQHHPSVASMKPPLVVPGEYHQFDATAETRAGGGGEGDQASEQIVLKSALKRKPDFTNQTAEHNELNTEVLQTPVPGKGGKAKKSSRSAKANKLQASGYNAGPEVERLTEMAKKYKVFLVMGVIEREGYFPFLLIHLYDGPPTVFTICCKYSYIFSKGRSLIISL